eukprot:scaffold30089_cov61-Attheya_sp.AAC.2
MNLPHEQSENLIKRRTETKLWCPCELWSYHDVPERLLKENDNHEDLETIYRTAVSAETVMAMPTSTVGTNSMAIRVPAFTLGGTPFVFGFALRSNRKLFGTFPAKLILPLNVVLVPLLIFGSCVYYLGGSTVVRADISVIQPFWGVLLGLVAGFGWITLTSAVAVYEHRLYSSKMSQRALELGMNHIETAQMYMTSESFVRPCAQQQKEKHKKEQISKQKDLMIQTKVRPYKGANGYAKTVQACIENLGVTELDFLAVHGVNLAEHVDDAIACARACKPLLDSQQVKAIGFSFHCQKKDAIRIIDTGLLSLSICISISLVGTPTLILRPLWTQSTHARWESCAFLPTTKADICTLPVTNSRNCANHCIQWNLICSILLNNRLYTSPFYAFPLCCKMMTYVTPKKTGENWPVGADTPSLKISQ